MYSSSKISRAGGRAAISRDLQYFHFIKIKRPMGHSAQMHGSGLNPGFDKPAIKAMLRLAKFVCGC